mgnify:CR=1 FL=1
MHKNQAEKPGRHTNKKTIKYTNQHKYTNTQIRKYTNTQIHKYANTQIHNYKVAQKGPGHRGGILSLMIQIQTQIHRSTSHKYTYTQIHKYANTQIHKNTNTQIHKYARTNTPEPRPPAYLSAVGKRQSCIHETGNPERFHLHFRKSSF